MARVGWEYAVVAQARDMREDARPARCWVWLPGHDEGQEQETPSAFTVLQRLGAEGWELVAGPETASLIVGVPAKNGLGDVTTIDGSDWYKRTFWLKRPVEG